MRKYRRFKSTFFFSSSLTGARAWANPIEVSEEEKKAAEARELKRKREAIHQKWLLRNHHYRFTFEE